MHWAALYGKTFNVHLEYFFPFFRPNIIGFESHFPGFEKVIRLLLDKGYKYQIHEKDYDGVIPLYFAVYGRK